MKRKQIIVLATLVVAATFWTGCPKQKTHTTTTTPPSNPSFFVDRAPEQGPWTVQVNTNETTYQKMYVHKSQEAIISSTFVKTEGASEDLDLTDPRNQRALAESALSGFCKAIQAECVVDSSDLAWIVGTSMQYVYVRFRAEKPNVPLMTGLIYYRFDPPFQTMYLLVADRKTYDGFETAFLNYVSQVEFKPENIK